MFSPKHHSSELLNEGLHSRDSKMSVSEPVVKTTTQPKKRKLFTDELKKMLRENFINVLTRENTIGFLDKRIDRNFLIDNISDFTQHFYVCGPDDFVKSIIENLKDLGAKTESLVFEQ